MIEYNIYNEYIHDTYVLAATVMSLHINYCHMQTLICNDNAYTNDFSSLRSITITGARSRDTVCHKKVSIPFSYLYPVAVMELKVS